MLSGPPGRRDKAISAMPPIIARPENSPEARDERSIPAQLASNGLERVTLPCESTLPRISPLMKRPP